MTVKNALLMKQQCWQDLGGQRVAGLLFFCLELLRDMICENMETCMLGRLPGWNMEIGAGDA